MLSSVKHLENGYCKALFFKKKKKRRKAQFSAVTNIPFWATDYENYLYHYICILQILKGQGDSCFLSCMLQIACMCENVVHFLMMIKDYSVSKVLKTARYYILHRNKGKCYKSGDYPL